MFLGLVLALLPLVAGIGLHVSLLGDDINADGTSDFPFYTLQRAIDLSFNGDVIWVHDGIYNGTGNTNLVLRGKSVAINSVSGPRSTIIECSGKSRAFSFQSGDYALLQGFTITNGLFDEGGAVIITKSSPDFVNCIFSFSRALGAGGAVTISAGSKPTFNNCTFVNNTALLGGGVYSTFDSQPTFTGCLFLENMATSGGAMMCTEDCRALVVSSTLRNNLATSGGALAVEVSSAPTFVDSRFEGNVAQSGGGIYVANHAVATIRSSIINNNTAPLGGGIYIGDSSTLIITDTAVWFNAAGMGGGAMYVASKDGVANVYNSSLGFNTAVLQGAVYPTSLATQLENTSLNNTYCSGRGTWKGDPVVGCTCPRSTDDGQFQDCDIDCAGGTSPPCSSHGKCTRVSGQQIQRCEWRGGQSICVFENAPTCMCDFGYLGSQCNAGCPGLDPRGMTVCSGNGFCVLGTKQNLTSPDVAVCSCHFGWAGSDCSRRRLYIASGSPSLSGPDSIGNRVVRIGDKMLINNDNPGLNVLAFNATSSSLDILKDETYATVGDYTRGAVYIKDGLLVTDDGFINVNASIAANLTTQNIQYLREKESNKMINTLTSLMTKDVFLVVSSYVPWLNQTNVKLNALLRQLGGPDLTAFLGDQVGTDYVYLLACHWNGTAVISSFQYFNATSVANPVMSLGVFWDGSKWSLEARESGRLESWDLDTDLDVLPAQRWDHGACKKNDRVFIASDQLFGSVTKLLCYSTQLDGFGGKTTFGVDVPTSSLIANSPKPSDHQLFGNLPPV